MNQIKICYWNANGLSQHKIEVESFLKSQSIDILLVSETHFTLKNCFRIKGYSVYDTKHPSGKACGGAAIIINNQISHFPMLEYKTEHIQASSICLSATNITISSLYCPPRHKITDDQFITFYKTLGNQFIAAGDYNAKHTFWGSRLTTPKGRQLLRAISYLKLDAISGGQPTYWPSDLHKTPDLIDFAVTKNIRRDQLSIASLFDLSSDHSPTIISMVIGQTIAKPFCFPNRHTNWLKYRKYVSSHLSQNISLISEDEIQDAINMFSETISTAAKVATPFKQYDDTKNNKYSTTIENLIKEKRNLRRQWQLYRSPTLKSQLNHCQRTLHRALLEDKQAALKAYLEGIDPTKATDYSLWKATKKLNNPTSHESAIRHSDGNWARSHKDKAEVFANHLESVFTPNISTSDITLPTIQELVFSPMKIRFSSLSSAIKKLKTNKTPGMDRISGRMIRELPTTALKLVLFIFNSILRTGFYPKSWKISQIIMIPKPGKDASQVSSYRPISLLSILSKLFEKVFLNALTPYLNDHHIIPVHQFGFRKDHGTIEQVHRIVTLVRKAFEDKLYCSSLFIDISQAFDKVWHDGLVYKICSLLPQNTHKLLRNYLLDRSFIVKYKDHFSDSRKITAGVPQGSILGPLMYILFTSDMPTNNLVHTSTFADDTAFISVHKNPVIASCCLQDHIKELEKWLDKWKIKVNPTKCVHVTFTLRKGNCPKLKINNIDIPEQNHVKYLGIHLDRRLTWSQHIESKSTQLKLKTSQLQWLLCPHSALNLNCKVLIYKSIIKPIWTYGIQLWGTASASNIEKLQKRQNKILRLITGDPWFIRNANIHKDLNIPLIRDEIKTFSSKYVRKLATHPNPLAQDLLSYNGHIRLKRIDTLALAVLHER